MDDELTTGYYQQDGATCHTTGYYQQDGATCHTTGDYQQDGAKCHTSNASMREIESFFLKTELSQKILATQISRSNVCRLIFWGPI
jgi:hypothetical protein